MRDTVYSVNGVYKWTFCVGTLHFSLACESSVRVFFKNFKNPPHAENAVWCYVKSIQICILIRPILALLKAQLSLIAVRANFQFR